MKYSIIEDGHKYFVSHCPEAKIKRGDICHNSHNTGTADGGFLAGGIKITGSMAEWNGPVMYIHGHKKCKRYSRLTLNEQVEWDMRNEYIFIYRTKCNLAFLNPSRLKNWQLKALITNLIEIRKIDNIQDGSQSRRYFLPRCQDDKSPTPLQNFTLWRREYVD